MRIGYRRVSTLDQSTARQLDGVPLDKVFEDKASGKDTARPELQAALEWAREGDRLIIHSMDRLARNLSDLRQIVGSLTSRGVAVEFVKENMTFTNESTPMAQFMLNIMGAFAELERSMIRERQKEGVTLAKKAGRYHGRAPAIRQGNGKLETMEQMATEAERAGVAPKVAEMARAAGVSRQTVYTWLARRAASKIEEVAA